MSDPSNIDVVDAEMEIVENGQVETALTSEVSELPAGSNFAVRLDIAPAAYLYVVELGDDDEAHVVYSSSPDRVGTNLRFPSDGFFTAPVDGEIRVALSPQPVAESDWEDLLKGRDPKPTKHKPT